MADRGGHRIQRTGKVAAASRVHAHHEDEELRIVRAELGSEPLESCIERGPKVSFLEEAFEERSCRANELSAGELQSLTDRQPASKSEAGGRSELGEVALQPFGSLPALPAGPNQGNGCACSSPYEQSQRPCQDPPDAR